MTNDNWLEIKKRIISAYNPPFEYSTLESKIARAKKRFEQKEKDSLLYT